MQSAVDAASLARNSEVALYNGGSNRCGYCSMPGKTCRTEFSMDSRFMTASDYQSLIDRGWRRSGTYMYKPDNRSTCCPNWTIRLFVPNFIMSKRQKKVLRQFQHYIKFGTRAELTSEPTPASPCTTDNSSEIAMISYLRCAVQQVLRDNLLPSDVPFSIKSSQKHLICNVSMVVMSHLKRHCIQVSQDLHQLGLQIAEALSRFDLHDMKTGIPIKVDSDSKGFVHFSAETDLVLPKIHPRKQQTGQRRTDSPSEPVVRFSTQIVPSRFTTEAFLLYQKYQVAVHHDPLSKLTEDQYTYFLCETPLAQEQSADPGVIFGSFHVEYRFNGTLVAVSVIDILPRCVSSVYFFYDPEFSFLSLGVYSALHEISLVPDSRLLPDLKYYYLGFYIQNCPKMLYKRQFSPSELLCPEHFTWHSIEACIPLLNLNKYVVFSHHLEHSVDRKSDDGNDSEDSSASVDDVKLLLSNQEYRFSDFKKQARIALLPKIQQFFDCVGPRLATKRLIIFDI